MSLASTLRDLATGRIALRDTLELNAVGLATIPMLAFIGPQVLRNDAGGCRVRIPLNYRTGNHMGSMYFGVLCAGADVVGGMPVVRLMRERRQFLAPSFKDVHAEFLQRAEGDVTFENQDLAAIAQAFDETLRTGRRVNIQVRSAAHVEGRDAPVARFTTTLSMKFKPDAKLPFVQRVLARL